MSEFEQAAKFDKEIDEWLHGDQFKGFIEFYEYDGIKNRELYTGDAGITLGGIRRSEHSKEQRFDTSQFIINSYKFILKAMFKRSKKKANIEHGKINSELKNEKTQNVKKKPKEILLNENIHVQFMGPNDFDKEIQKQYYSATIDSVMKLMKKQGGKTGISKPYFLECLNKGDYNAYGIKLPWYGNKIIPTGCILVNRGLGWFRKHEKELKPYLRTPTALTRVNSY